MRASRHYRAEASALACLLALCFLSIPAQAKKAAQVLHNHVRPAVANGRAARVGPMPNNQRLRLAIMLPLRNQSELTDLLKRLYDRSSPDYRHFLNVGQFTERFGATKSDYQAVVKFARSKGFTVTNLPANRMLVHLEGTVSHIAGMNNFSLPQPKFKRAPPNFRRNAVGSGPGGAYLGGDMRAAYYGGTTLTGSGQAVGLLEFDGYNMSDVTASFAGQSNPVPIHNVLLDGATAGSDGDDGEQVLDIVQAASMAPGLSQVRVYIAPGNSQIGVGDVDIFNEMA